MSTLLPTLISWLQLYGYPALWLCVYIAAVGIPLPVSLILLALGAFTALGDFNLPLLAITTISASVCGDCTGYWIGRKVGQPLVIWLGRQNRFRLISPKALQRSQSYFARHGSWAIFLSRCLIPALGGAINILAGAEVFPFLRFFLIDLIGETLGALPPLILGYIFGASWEAIGNLLSQISTLLLILLIAAYLIRLLIRTIRNARVNYRAAHTIEKNAEVEIFNDSVSQLSHKKSIHQNHPKKTYLFATLRKVETYKSTDGLHSNYNFPTETRSNTGHGD